MPPTQDRLVQATDRLHGKRKRARDRYIQLNRCILVALIVQAVVTTYIAGFKTLLMPDFDFSMDVALEDVDMVMMLDASGHLGHLRQDQHRAVMSVTDTMAEALEDLRYKSRVEASRMMQVARIAKSNWFDFDRADYTLRNPKDPGKPFDKVVPEALGGQLRDGPSTYTRPIGGSVGLGPKSWARVVRIKGSEFDQDCFRRGRALRCG